MSRHALMGIVNVPDPRRQLAVPTLHRLGQARVLCVGMSRDQSLELYQRLLYCPEGSFVGSQRRAVFHDEALHVRKTLEQGVMFGLPVSGVVLPAREAGTPRNVVRLYGFWRQGGVIIRPRALVRDPGR